jgi:hypothetical protein
MNDSGEAVFQMEVRELVRQLSGKAIRDEADIGLASMLNLVSTPVRAKWACTTAIAMASSIPELIPDSADGFRSIVTFQLKLFLDPLP